MFFVISSMLIFCATAVLIPKKLSWNEIYTTSLFAYAFVALTDMILDVKLNLYGYFEKGIQWLGLVEQAVIIPAVSTIILNLYPSNKSLPYKALHVFLSTLGFLAFEWLSLKAGVFYYNGWNMIYSAIFYPFAIILLLLNLKLIIKKQGSVPKRYKGNKQN